MRASSIFLGVSIIGFVCSIGYATLSVWNQGPHIGLVCTASYDEVIMMPQMINGNTTMMPMSNTVCTQGYNACVHRGQQVDESLCAVKE